MPTEFEKAEILGAGVSRLTTDQLIRSAIDRARNRAKSTIAYANVHVLNTAHRDAELRGILNDADIVYCDGAGVQWASGVLGRRLPERMTGADWIESLCGACVKESVSLFFVGGKPGVAERAALLLRERYRGLKILGAHHGYLSESDANSEAISAVNAVRPDILLVGMGTPAQERWIAANRAGIEAPVVWAVGALFDFVAGVQPRAPRWMRDHGMEWMYRFATDPVRLGSRYLVGNPLFLWRVVKQRVSLRSNGSVTQG